MMNHYNFFVFIIVLINLSANLGQKLKTEQIVGGAKAKEDDFKYQVSIHRSNSHKCGGAIIDDFHIIAAGHCFVNITSGRFINEHITVVAAAIDIHNIRQSTIIDQVIKVYVPATFRPSVPNSREPQLFHDDIGVAKLKNGLKLSDRPCLQKLKIAYLVSYIGHTLSIAGHGYYRLTIKYPLGYQITGKKIGHSDGHLRFADTLIVDSNLCLRIYPNFDPNQHICGKLEQLHQLHSDGLCLGDNGSPVVYDGRILVGVVIYIDEWCRNDYRPLVFTNVAYYSKFIANVTMNRKNKKYIRSATWKRPLLKSKYKFVEN